MNQFKFIPSVSAGYLFAGATALKLFKNGTNYQYYNYQGKHAYPYFLIPAAGNLKRNIAEKADFFKFPETEIFGDSGGFQIANGTTKWKPEILSQTLSWLEHNSTIAANLDIPPRGNQFNFSESLEISKNNFEYFHTHQSGKTKFLNVLQGKNLLEQEKWYSKVKHFTDFHGWAIGDVRQVIAIFNSYYLFLKNKEHLRSRVLHYLGASSPLQFVILAHIQSALNLIGCDIQIYSDSSSPNSARFGTYYTEINYNTMAWRNLHTPYIRGEQDELKTDSNLTKDQKIEILNSNSVDTLPLYTEFDRDVFIHLFDHDDMVKYNERFGAALILRNIHVFKTEVDKINQFVRAPEYFRESIFNKEVSILGSCINKLTNVHDSTIQLDKLYTSFLPLFQKYGKNNTGSIPQHNFF